MRVFNVTQDAGLKAQADDLMDEAAVRQFRADVRRKAREFVSLFDFDPALEVFQCKVIDALCRALEKVRDNTEQAGLSARAELKMLERVNADTEFDYEAHDRLTKRLTGLRTQFWTARLAFEALLDARTEVVGASGIDWPRYETMKQMAAQNMTKRRMKDAAIRANQLLGMSEEDYRRWLRDGRYEVQHDGIDADDGAGSGASKVANFREEQERRQRGQA